MYAVHGVISAPHKQKYFIFIFIWTVASMRIENINVSVCAAAYVIELVKFHGELLENNLCVFDGAHDRCCVCRLVCVSEGAYTTPLQTQNVGRQHFDVRTICENENCFNCHEYLTFTHIMFHQLDPKYDWIAGLLFHGHNWDIGLVNAVADICIGRRRSRGECDAMHNISAFYWWIH